MAYRSLKESITALELCVRLYPSLRQDSIANHIDEGNQNLSDDSQPHSEDRPVGVAVARLITQNS
jgi:hypothetical protein